MGQRVLEIVNLTHGYSDRRLFDDVSLEMEKGERVALIGESPCQEIWALDLHTMLDQMFLRRNCTELWPATVIRVVSSFLHGQSSCLMSPVHFGRCTI